MEYFNISDYLENYDKITKQGTCQLCLSKVQWVRERVASHKRGSCPNISSEEKKKFAKRKYADSFSNERSVDEQSNSSFTGQTSTKEELDEITANFFFRTGIAFRIADSKAWKILIGALNPAYAADMASAKMLSGRLLEQQYVETSKKLKTVLNETEGLMLASDGWTNIKGDHIVNFIIKAPSHQPFFYKSVDTTGIPQTALAISEEITKVLEEVGSSKFCSVVVDNANVMQAACKLIEEKYPFISAYGCAAHGANLLIKDIVGLPEYSKTINNGAKIIQFINNHHVAHAKFEEKRKEAGVKHKLSSPVATRWYTEYTSAKDLLDAKILLARLAHEDFEVLSNINPKAASSKALSLMMSSDFCGQLDSLVNVIELPTKIIGKVIKMCSCNFVESSYFILGKFEADNAPLYLVYKYFGEMYKHFSSNIVLREKVKRRWDFLSTECTGISYMLTPKFAADGFYIDNDKIDIVTQVNKLVSSRFPGLGDQAQDEMIQFVSKMSSMHGARKETVFKMDSRSYWNIIGQYEFPTLWLCAKTVNEMICSSAASERVWSIYRFIHSRLRNRLANDKVEKLAFVYVNCAILDKNDQTDYILDEGAVLNGTDCQDED